MLKNWVGRKGWYEGEVAGEKGWSEGEVAGERSGVRVGWLVKGVE